MDYNQIDGFFNKFKNILFQKNKEKEIIKNVISKTLCCEIKDDFFDFRKGIINLKASPVFKNEVLIKKERILREIKEVSQGQFVVIDIK